MRARGPVALVTGLLAAGLLVTGLLVTGQPPAVAVDDRPVVLTRGHIDLFELTYDAGSDGLRLQVKDDTGLHGPGPLFHDPGAVTIAVDEERSRVVVPEGLPPAFDFLGEPGDVVYDLPFTQDPELPWPGWSTERLVASLPDGVELSPTGHVVEFSVDVDGPGDVHTFMSDAVGMPVAHYVDTTDGGPDVIPATSHQHAHTEWVFTELGDYTLTVVPRARTTTGRTLTGPAEVYHFRVGDGVATGTADLTLSRSRQVYGDRAPATARIDVTTADGAPGAGTVDVSVDGRQVADDVAVTAGTARVRVPRDLRPGVHEIRAEFTPADPGLDVVPASPAVLRVTKAPVAVRARLAARRVAPGRRARVAVVVALPKSVGVSPAGKVTVRDGRTRVGSGALRGGKVTVTLPRLREGRHAITVRYAGNALLAAGTSPTRVLVVGR